MCTLTHGASPRFDVCVWKSLAHRLPHCVVGGRGAGPDETEVTGIDHRCCSQAKALSSLCALGWVLSASRVRAGERDNCNQCLILLSVQQGQSGFTCFFFLFLTDTVVIRYMSVSHLSNNKKMSKLNKFSLFIQYKKTVLPLLQLIFCFYSAFKQNKDLRERLYNAKFPCCYMLNFVG